MIGDNDPTFYHFVLINWRTTRNDLIFMTTDCLICIFTGSDEVLIHSSYVNESYFTSIRRVVIYTSGPRS